MQPAGAGRGHVRRRRRRRPGRRGRHPSGLAAAAAVHADRAVRPPASTASSAARRSRAIGGMAGAIGRRAEEVYAGRSTTAGRRTPASCSPASSRPDTARPTPAGGRGSASSRPGMRAVADAFVAARLLVADRDPATREPTVEVAHEALLTRWSRLVGWVDEDRRWLAQLQHLSAAARAWDDGGRRDAELYRGVRLEAAIEALDVDGRTVSDLERTFVEAGRHARDAESSRPAERRSRLRRRLTAVAVALVVALVAGAVAVVQRVRPTTGRRPRRWPTRRRAPNATPRSRRSSAAPSRCARPSATPPRCSPSRPTGSPTRRGPARRCSARSPTTTFLDAHRFDGRLGAQRDRDARRRARPTSPTERDGCAPTSSTPDRSATRCRRSATMTGFPCSPHRRTAVARAGIEVGPQRRADHRRRVRHRRRGRCFRPLDRRRSRLLGGLPPDDAPRPGDRRGGPPARRRRRHRRRRRRGPRRRRLPVDDSRLALEPQPSAAGRCCAARPRSRSSATSCSLGAADGSLRVFDAVTLRPAPDAQRGARHALDHPPSDDGTAVTPGRLGIGRGSIPTTGRDHVAACPSQETLRQPHVDEQRGVFYCGDAYGRLEEHDLETAVPCSDGSTPRTATAARCGQPATGPNWSASATTNPSSPAGALTARDRSPTSSPRWKPSEFNHARRPPAPRARRPLRRRLLLGRGRRRFGRCRRSPRRP